MGINDQYTNEESAYETAFSIRSTCCSCTCLCGRIFFVSCHGHGDYEENELEGYLEKAKQQPDKYIESSIFDRIDIDAFGYVIQCPCGGSQRYIGFLEQNRKEIVDYLVIRYKQLEKAVAGELAEVSLQKTQLERVAAVPTG